MVRKRLRRQSERVSPEVVDAALRAFWRGSARPIDRLAGGPVGDAEGPGEMLLTLWGCVGAGRAGRATIAEEERW